MNYLQFDLETRSVEQSERLVAVLGELGFEGFEEEGDCLHAFIAEDKLDAEEFSRSMGLFPGIIYRKTVVENINWNQKWEEDFEPVLVDDFVAIRAGFHQPVIHTMHEIIITPKMSFGTGHHATTWLMIRQMRQLDFANKTVLDFGTGTGVLAILAARLGAKKVLAIDCDEWSIINATENISQNNISCIEIVQSERVPPNEKFDIILANINLNVILDSLGAITACASSGTRILLSGFLKENEPQLKTAVADNNLNYLSTAQRGDWIVVMIENP